MAIKITEDGVVRYVNENDVDRTMFPNLTGAMGDEQYDALNGRLTVVEGKVTDLEECCTDVNTDITEIKNNIEQLEERTYSAFVVETESGAVASFTDGADDVPVKDLSVAIEPVQDLHGQSSPYPAGGGVNKLDVSKLVSNDTSYGLTVSFDGDWIVISGTYNNALTAPNFRIAHYSDTADLPTYLKAFPDASSSSHFSPSSLGKADSNKTLTIYLINMVQGETYNLRFRAVGYEGDADPTEWSPYENICPISGWTGANVTRTGKNLCQGFERYNVTNYVSSPVFLKAGEQYTVSFESDITPSSIYLTKGVLGTDIIQYKYNTKQWTFAPNESRIYLLRFYESGTGWNNHTFSNVQLELGSTATEYEAPHIDTLPITFPTEAGTVYGGTLDVTTGVLTVTHGMITSYNGETLSGEWISDRDVYEEGTSPTTGAQVVYELTTSQTYQLTPHEVSTVLGQNNIFADCGNVTVQYRADTKLYIDKVINT